ncbi:MAG TPA: hypothetical protein VI583_18645, partial [Cyclobacteriaceae bacterium]|nr:hypothetical protein [Cyclobacteriaceae bacterium]
NNELKAILKKSKIYLPAIYPLIIKLYENTVNKYMTGDLKKDGLYRYANDKIRENFQQGKQLLCEVDALASNFGNIEKTAYYDHAVVIDFKNFNISRRELDNEFRRVINQIRIEAKKYDHTYLFEISAQYSAIKTGIWVCSQGKNSRRWLLNLCSKLIEALDNNSTIKFTFFFHLDPFRIIKKISSNQYYAPLFWDVAKELLRKKFKLEVGHEIIYFTASMSNKSSIENEIKNELKGFYQNTRGEKEFEITKPYNLTFYSNHYIKDRSTQIRNIMDIGIITIVTEELVAVTDYFKENTTFFEKKGTQTARTYYFGKIKDKKGKDLNVVTIQAIDQGNRSVIVAYNALAEEFNPSLIVLIGIGGSIHKNVNICDVAICESTYYFDKRAETVEGTQHRIDTFKINSWTKEFIRKYHYENKTEEPSFNAAINSPDEKFKSFFGPIGTGEAVIKYKDAEDRKWLLSVNDKTLAIETEAGGIAQQFYEDELNYSRRAKGILIIRGISDKADINKNDDWRLAASKNAMKVFEEILKVNNLD